MDLNVITEADAEHRREAAVAATSTEAIPSQTEYDDAYSRLLKLVPIPVVGAYVAVQNILVSVPLDGAIQQWVLLGIFAVLAVLTVLYFLRRGMKRVSQIIMSVVALGIWAAAVTFPSWITGILIILAGAAVVVLRLRPIPSSK